MNTLKRAKKMVLKCFRRAITSVTKKKSNHSKVEMYEDSLIRDIDQLANFVQYHSDNAPKSEVPEIIHPINRSFTFCIKKSENNSISNEQTVSVKQDQQKENEKLPKLFGNNKTMSEETPNSVSEPSVVKTSTAIMNNGDSIILKRNTAKSYKMAKERIPSFFLILPPVSKNVKKYSNNPKKSTNMVNSDTKKINRKITNLLKKTEERLPGFFFYPTTLQRNIEMLIFQ
ncbi:uncharacterized protein LOC126894594 [Daktulosphaira vitifoliae]|uniref:uncharacterized protein LOC126894594 n=1 Tax=Daktulosphaira vitifoliae TaxID=58002 RepID=UPI0021AA5E8A|nr:uncharacterized protein LOC126894594 [Daktulosphaira vitifoliae]